ncbi:sugar transferase [Pseudotabrizicola sp. 4114]|uniref:sugar transferase n=1 Tax=Pseudotabrizicola sp. 4114 TaxID=2817731 RepID=UPI0028608BCD|nr:lipopolysaccharide/colanic/teichoic acid biosynthesis glycosyltransferase [Pseudorhodobacter sp. 4114]
MSITFPEFQARSSEPVKSPPDFTGLPLLPPARPFGLYRNLFKRVLDVAAILAAAPVVLPVVAGLAVCVALDGGSPFYSQLRLGKGGKIFRMWKLRSMVRDADAQMADLLSRDPVAREEWNATQKLRNDPRITGFGQFLRRSSLDELPQLWNVLTGDMSLVGPRPMMVDQKSLYPGTAYYALRPGITGYWQTAGRNRTTFRARAEYDTVYEEGLALTADLKILWRTVSVVMNGTGC